MSKVTRDSKGRFVSIRPDKDLAIFASVGPGTCNAKNLRIVMKSWELGGSQKGKVIEFVDGKYSTRDPEVYKFLKWKEANPIPFCKIKCIQEPVFEEEVEEETEKKQKDEGN